MKIKTKAVLTVVILLCAGAYRVYCMNKPDDTPEYVNHYDEVYDVLQDEEGMQTMRILGRNMAYYLKCIEAGKKAGIELPKREKTILTNFIKK